MAATRCAAQSEDLAISWCWPAWPDFHARYTASAASTISTIKALAKMARLRGSSWLRSFSAGRNSDTLSRWLQEWVAVPPVVVPDGCEPPTALLWLRRRGPPLPEAALHKLFRSSTVRLYEPASKRVVRAARARPLPPGATLLLPRAVLGAGGGGSNGGPAIGRQPEAAAARGARLGAGAAAWAARLRAAVLHAGPDFLAINKPAGLACQGGRSVRHSVDRLAAAAFAGLPGLPGDSRQLRLVHRLDRGTSGALLLAAGADSAAWLAAAFRGGAQPQPQSNAAAISKTYWAVVALPPGATALSRSGTVSLPVASSKGGGAEVPALTRFRLLHSAGGLAWLELSPHTGRKHQLRLHCARGLGAPILGDQRYGEVRAQPQAAALAELAAVAAALGTAGGGGGNSPPLFLHCRRLVVRRLGGADVAVTAPLPPAWRALLARQGWPLPDDA